MDPIENFRESVEVDSAQPRVEPIKLVRGELPLGTVVEGRYKILDVIGRGGFGVVYRVSSLLSKKDLALKTLTSIGATEVSRLRLRKEAEACSRLTHPNLVQAVDFGFIQDELPYLIMEFITGETLAELLQRKGSLPLTEALGIFIPVADGLAYAHHNGVVHRDIKPSNIILEQSANAGSAGTGPSAPIAKIVDFGIAKIRFPDENEVQALTQTGDVFGTPLYMSPEQCAGDKIDQRADIYALGCVIFEALAGTPPFQGRTALETIIAQANEKPPTLKEASMGKEFPQAIESIVSKMLEKEPENRYQDCDALRNDLQLAAHGKNVPLSNSEKAKAAAGKSGGAKTQLHISGRTAAIAAAAVALTAGFCWFVANSLGKSNETTSHFPRSTFERQETNWYVPHVVTTGGYFSEVKGNERVFHFPKQTIGFLDWFGCASPVLMKGEVRVPANVALYIRGGPDLMEQSLLLNKFRADEIYGVVVEEHIQTNKDDAEQLIKALMGQKHLRLIRFKNVPVSADCLRDIGRLESLRWLDFHKVNEDTRVKKVQADQIARLGNLSKLRMLFLGDAVNVKTLIPKLREANKIERLALANVDLFTEKDLLSVTQIKSLKTLVVIGDAVPRMNGFIESLRKMPNLTRLAIDYPLSKRQLEDDLSGLKKLTKLKAIHFTVLGRSSIEKSGVTKADIATILPPQLNVDRDVKIFDTPNPTMPYDSRRTGDSGWFDVQYEDLRQLD